MNSNDVNFKDFLILTKVDLHKIQTRNETQEMFVTQVKLISMFAVERLECQFFQSKSVFLFSLSV